MRHHSQELCFLAILHQSDYDKKWKCVCTVAIRKDFSGCPQACRNEHVTAMKSGTAQGDTSSCLLASDFEHEASRENLQCNCMIHCFKYFFFFNIILCKVFFLSVPHVMHINLHEHTKFSDVYVMDYMAGGMCCSHVPSHLWGWGYWQ